jgi:type IV secretory pathway VirB10-like protein
LQLLSKVIAMKDYVEPHFDDERTLLSARRVVPLEKIEKKARHRRQWFLGGAFALAMMLGAASALVASYLKQRNLTQTAPQTAIEQPTEPHVADEPVAVAEGTPAEAPVVEATPEDLETPDEEEEVTTPPVTPKREAPKRKAVAERHDEEPVEDRDTRQMSEEDQLQQIRSAVLYDQWEERRARRALRRERRRAERYNHRDLSNLNEIFEGRRRP